MLRMQFEAPLQQEQQHLLLLQQQGKWKAAQDAKILSGNVCQSDFPAEPRGVILSPLMF